MKTATTFKAKAGLTPSFTSPLKSAVDSATNEANATSASNGDVLFQIVQEVEKTVSKGEAFAMVDSLGNVEGEATFKRGGVLSVILYMSKKDPEWLEGHASFEKLCDKRFKLGYRKSMYLIDIYEHLRDEKIPWAMVKDLHWTKLRELASKKVITKKNAAKWVKDAENLTVEQLRKMLKKTSVKGQTEALVIKVQYEDQKEAVRAAIEKAKEEAGTEYDGVALHTMATKYLCNAIADVDEQKPKQKGKLKEYWTKRLTKDVDEVHADLDGQDALMAVLAVLEKKWPDVKITVDLPA